MHKLPSFTSLTSRPQLHASTNATRPPPPVTPMGELASSVAMGEGPHHPYLFFVECIMDRRARGLEGTRLKTPPQICTFSGDVAGRCDAAAIEASSLDSTADNATTIFHGSKNCSEVNCFCAVQ